nr:aminopeptidase P family protein [uncultured Niameybacter sp.]
MSQEFYIETRKHLGEQLEEGSLTILFSGTAPKKSADEAYPFTTNRNFYYLCGIKEEGITLALKKVNGQVEASLFIKKADPVMEKWVGKTISKEEAENISGIKKVCYLDEFEGMLHYNMMSGQVDKLYLDFEIDGFNKPVTHEQNFANKCKEKYPFIQFKNIHGILAKLRMIKTPYEVDMIKEALKVTDEGIKALMKNAKSGMMEYALEAHFDFVLKTHGIEDYAFKTIAASGSNATVLHYSSNNSMIPKDSLILFDLGAQYKYYNADISRTFPVDGKFTERQKTFYNIVLRANLEVIDMIKPGVAFAKLNERVREIYFEELKKLGMVETPEDVSKYYYHGVSHFLGLDTHDVGERNATLQEGMVLTVEPGLYIEEEAIGIRIEDDVLVTATGSENLSKDIIKTVEDIEAFMEA